MKSLSQRIAFTLIEVVVAAGILSLTVFGVYKLIGENTKLLGQSQNNSQLVSLFPGLKECVKYLGAGSFSGNSVNDTIDFTFGSDLMGCGVGNIPEVRIDGILYSLSGKITAKDTSSITWNLSIEGEGVGKESANFILK